MKKSDRLISQKPGFCEKPGFLNLAAIALFAAGSVGEALRMQHRFSKP